MRVLLLIFVFITSFSTTGHAAITKTKPYWGKDYIHLVTAHGLFAFYSQVLGEMAKTKDEISPEDYQRILQHIKIEINPLKDDRKLFLDLSDRLSSLPQDSDRVNNPTIWLIKISDEFAKMAETVNATILTDRSSTRQLISSQAITEAFVRILASRPHTERENSFLYKKRFTSEVMIKPYVLKTYTSLISPRFVDLKDFSKKPDMEASDRNFEELFKVVSVLEFNLKQKVKLYVRQ